MAVYARLEGYLMFYLVFAEQRKMVKGPREAHKNLPGYISALRACVVRLRPIHVSCVRARMVVSLCVNHLNGIQ